MLWPISQRISRRTAMTEALRRASNRCVVIKALNQALDRADVIDIRHALEVMSIECEGIPEAHAAQKIIERILKMKDTGQLD